MSDLTHFVSLDRTAGVELQFAELVRSATRRLPEWRHHLLHPGKAIDTHVSELLSDSLSSIGRTKYWHSFRLPSRPSLVRRLHCRRYLSRSRSRPVLIWNRSSRVRYLVDAAGPDLCIHYEHGAAWFRGNEAERRGYFGRIPSAIAISQAAAAVLRQIWGYAGDIDVCPNALRPSLVPPASCMKLYPVARRIRLGVAARLFPVKGIALALHALRRLREDQMDIELRIAGAGPERSGLERLASSLGIASDVRFEGALGDMAGFYSEIDCLIHVPLSEAFGLVAIEAAAHGCPVIVASVDGLPEAVRDGVSGICVRPTLPLCDYASLGGATDGLPPDVYDPEAGEVGPARIVDPVEVARAVRDVFSDRVRFESLSRDAHAYVVTERRFDDYVDSLMAVIRRAADR